VTTDKPVVDRALETARLIIMCTVSGEISRATKAFRTGQPPHGLNVKGRGIVR
jgi:hypothetical protein